MYKQTFILTAVLILLSISNTYGLAPDGFDPKVINDWYMKPDDFLKEFDKQPLAGKAYLSKHTKNTVLDYLTRYYKVSGRKLVDTDYYYNVPDNLTSGLKDYNILASKFKTYEVLNDSLQSTRHAKWSHLGYDPEWIPPMVDCPRLYISINRAIALSSHPKNYPSIDKIKSEFNKLPRSWMGEIQSYIEVKIRYKNQHKIFMQPNVDIFEYNNEQYILDVANMYDAHAKIDNSLLFLIELTAGTEMSAATRATNIFKLRNACGADIQDNFLQMYGNEIAARIFALNSEDSQPPQVCHKLLRSMNNTDFMRPDSLVVWNNRFMEDYFYSINENKTKYRFSRSERSDLSRLYDNSDGKFISKGEVDNSGYRLYITEGIDNTSKLIREVEDADGNTIDVEWVDKNLSNEFDNLKRYRKIGEILRCYDPVGYMSIELSNRKIDKLLLKSLEDRAVKSCEDVKASQKSVDSIKARTADLEKFYSSELVYANKQYKKVLKQRSNQKKIGYLDLIDRISKDFIDKNIKNLAVFNQFFGLGLNEYWFKNFNCGNSESKTCNLLKNYAAEIFNSESDAARKNGSLQDRIRNLKPQNCGAGPDASYLSGSVHRPMTNLKNKYFTTSEFKRVMTKIGITHNVEENLISDNDLNFFQDGVKIGDNNNLARTIALEIIKEITQNEYQHMAPLLFTPYFLGQFSFKIKKNLKEYYVTSFGEVRCDRLKRDLTDSLLDNILYVVDPDKFATRIELRQDWAQHSDGTTAKELLVKVADSYGAQELQALFGNDDFSANYKKVVAQRQKYYDEDTRNQEHIKKIIGPIPGLEQHGAKYIGHLSNLLYHVREFDDKPGEFDEYYLSRFKTQAHFYCSVADYSKKINNKYFSYIDERAKSMAVYMKITGAIAGVTGIFLSPVGGAALSAAGASVVAYASHLEKSFHEEDYNRIMSKQKRFYQVCMSSMTYDLSQDKAGDLNENACQKSLESMGDFLSYNEKLITFKKAAYYDTAFAIFAVAQAGAVYKLSKSVSSMYNVTQVARKGKAFSTAAAAMSRAKQAAKWKDVAGKVSPDLLSMTINFLEIPGRAGRVFNSRAASLFLPFTKQAFKLMNRNRNEITKLAKSLSSKAIKALKSTTDDIAEEAGGGFQKNYTVDEQSDIANSCLFESFLGLVNSGYKCEADADIEEFQRSSVAVTIMSLLRKQQPEVATAEHYRQVYTYKKLLTRALNKSTKYLGKALRRNQINLENLEVIWSEDKYLATFDEEHQLSRNTDIKTIRKELGLEAYVN